MISNNLNFRFLIFKLQSRNLILKHSNYMHCEIHLEFYKLLLAARERGQHFYENIYV